jgi:uncharacterized lipoprotein YddW (UPF0748 family)
VRFLNFLLHKQRIFRLKHSTFTSVKHLLGFLKPCVSKGLALALSTSLSGVLPALLVAGLYLAPLHTWAAAPQRLALLVPTQTSAGYAKALQAFLLEFEQPLELINESQLNLWHEGATPLIVPLFPQPSLETLDQLRQTAERGHALVLVNLEGEGKTAEASLRGQRWGEYRLLLKDLALLAAPVSEVLTEETSAATGTTAPEKSNTPSALQLTVAIPNKALGQALLSPWGIRYMEWQPDKPLIPVVATPVKVLVKSSVAKPAVKAIVKAPALSPEEQKKKAEEQQKKTEEALRLAEEKKQEALKQLALLKEQQHAAFMALLEEWETLHGQASVAGLLKPKESAIFSVQKAQALQQLSRSKSLCSEGIEVAQRLGKAANRSSAFKQLAAANALARTAEESQALPALKTAIAQAQQAYTQLLLSVFPTQQGQGRAVWLDRGSLVDAANPVGLRQRLQTLHNAGINLIFIEALNAGFPIYPSRLLAEQNPAFKGWDPMQVAVEEGHKLGMEVHAWVWCFAAGNTRHNPIISKPFGYLGPMLTMPALANERLQFSNGASLPQGQHEYWLSPASPLAQTFLVDVYKELVSNYAVDGVQLDYIRFPFQKPYELAGFEPATLQRFQRETGITLNGTGMNAFQQSAFVKWKTAQVNHFVEQVSREIKAIRPAVKLSAAVFPIERYSRLRNIQQDWETWISKGWIDILVPMVYTQSPQELSNQLAVIQRAAKQGTLVYPGLGLHNLDKQQMLEQLLVTYRSGVAGHTLFANAYLTDDWLEALNQGPYRLKDEALPHHKPEVLLHAQMQQWQNYLLGLGRLSVSVATAKALLAAPAPQVLPAAKPGDNLQAKSLASAPPVNETKSLIAPPITNAATEVKPPVEVVTTASPLVTPPVVVAPVVPELTLSEKAQDKLTALQHRLLSAAFTLEADSELTSEQAAELTQQWQEVIDALKLWVTLDLRFRPYMADYLQGELKQMDHLFYYALRQVRQVPPEKTPVVAVQQPVASPAATVLPVPKAAVVTSSP